MGLLSRLGHGVLRLVRPVASTQTHEVDPRSVGRLRLAYAPHPDGIPDAGEIVWTWVPYAERDGRGKDRPVLVVARQSRDRVYAVKLTSRAHPGSDAYVALGAGAWDPQRRPSWADIDQLYSVSHRGLRREGATLDAGRFARVADALRARFGWR
jgi:mRNA-degrading endonuclease toxin of MazEF toxin-antitoxin module